MAITLSRLGTYQGAGSEISAYDVTTQRLYVVAGTSALEVLDVSNLTAPTLVKTIDTSAFGIANSIAVKNGIVAVAIENGDNKQAPGFVAFYDLDGNLLNSVTVGALPDMLTFTPDGKKIVVANEGEPSSYNQQDSVDPEGSISIIDLSTGVLRLDQSHVKTADFSAFNAAKDALVAAGVRIFGPNATVAQDLEPEYITVSPDSKTAWVTLQENNALAIVDLETATVKEIKPLGFKDHNSPTVTKLETFEFTNLPILGTTDAGQTIPLGGFSGLTFEGVASNGNLRFITHTDRGPNGEPSGINRPFLLPDFVPEIIRFELNRTTGQLSITERIQLQAAPGQPLSGLPNTQLSTNASQPYNDEVPVDLRGNPLSLDPLGADLEGIVVAPDGTFWMVDEYRPAIYHFDSSGVLINRFVPSGTAAAAGQLEGTYGIEVLPAVLAQRRQNRGFEAVAFQNGKVYAFVQSPLRNPSTLSNSVLNGLKNIRIVEFDPATSTTRQFLYIMDNPPRVSPTDTIADKIGDAVAIGNGEFLVVERDDDAIDSDPINQIQKKIYRFNLANATDISTFSDRIDVGGGVLKTLDQMTEAELKAAGIVPIQKSLHVDLTAAGYNTVEKVEGLTIIDRNTLAVINDNDFTVAGITIDQSTGTFTPDPDPESPVLGLITLQNNGLDASDRDGGINIQNWPVFGMYQPDAIASFTINGQTYLITANEGDARDYPGFAEEVRVGANRYPLDPTAFPNAAALKNNANLGRLTVTNTLGNPDGDNDFDQIYAFGARSFSIWNASGSLVYDSGDQLEQITATLTPDSFNSDGTAASFDTRSDNKGPEPEGVVIGVIDGQTYAFIGLERTGGVMVYNVTNPSSPAFVQYIITPGDVSPEGLAFVSPEDSPSGKPLLVVTHEVSNTTTTYEIATASGRGTVPVIQGTSGSDRLNGTSATEIFYGLDGNDSIFAGDGNNRVYAGNGNDKAYAGNGDDVLNGGAGNDDLYASEGNNRLYGGDGNDNLYAGSGDDTIYGNAGNDKIYAGEGKNLILAGDGDDLVYAGAGNDEILGGAGNDKIYAGEGVNWIDGGDGNDLIFAGAGNDTIYGGAGDNTINAGEGNNVIVSIGNDMINAGSGSDRFVLGVGSSVATITRFGLNDRIHLTGGLTFADLTVTGNNREATISVGSDAIAILKNFSVAQVNAELFG